jgi:hypothetical protein
MSKSIRKSDAGKPIDQARQNISPADTELDTTLTPGFDPVPKGDVAAHIRDKDTDSPLIDSYSESGDSSLAEDEGRVRVSARSSLTRGRDCAALLHELSNALTAVLVNAQMLEWKLPGYSHLKRPVRELERNAHRGGELIKQLVRRISEERVEQPAKQSNQIGAQDRARQSPGRTVGLEGPRNVS